MLPPQSVLSHVVDVHCHPTDSEVTSDNVKNLSISICAMATRQSDQQLVANLSHEHESQVIPCFGYHPWFSHTIALVSRPKEEHYRRLFQVQSDDGEQERIFQQLLALLPEPVPLEELLGGLRSNLCAFPHAMLGEVGIDRSFRIAFDYAANPRRLSPFKPSIEHQLAILEAQLDLAVELRRNVSLHSVKCQMHTMELLQRMQQRHGENWSISIDLHSCGLSPEMLTSVQKNHNNVFMSLSTVINGRSENHKALISACQEGRLLAESDIHMIEECTRRTWDMIETIAEVKKWAVESEWGEAIAPEKWGVVHRLEANWKAFQGGNHSISKVKQNNVLAM